MKLSSMPNLYMALIHYPVVNKQGEIIASAVTNLDLHDMARAAKTYGVRGFYVVTPLADQMELVKKIISHWITGAGARYNPVRREALELIRVMESAEAAEADICQQEQGSPKTVVTCARSGHPCISYSAFREMIQEDKTPYLLNFGTAWGLSEEFIASADYVLEPISGNTGYNHLSVRAASAIILDRLMGV